MVQAARKLRHPIRVKVGERVGISVGGCVLGAEVIEDRGDLGAHGQQVVRLAVKDAIDPADAYEVEVPVEWLLAAPARPRAGR